MSLALAACDAFNEGHEDGRRDAEDARIECMPAGETAFRRVCDVERMRADSGDVVLTIRSPDGGFRRLAIVPGKGVVAADGAEQAVVTVLNDREIEVALAGNRYRLPATVK